jgi:hypothetical protein
MARSIALSPGFADTSARVADSFAPAKAPAPVPSGRAKSAPAKSIIGRILARLLKARQNDLDRAIEHYLADRGYDHFTDSIERDIEQRFLGRAPERF